MAKEVEVPIPLDPDVAATLTDAESRAAAGRLLSLLLKPGMQDERLAGAVRAEIIEVSHRPRLSRYFRPESRDAVLAALQSDARWFRTDQVVADCRDPNDNK